MSDFNAANDDSAEKCARCSISLVCVSHGRASVSFSFCEGCGGTVAVFPDGFAVPVDSMTVLNCAHGVYAGRKVRNCLDCGGEGEVSEL